jgi:hypothetical protein
VKEQGSPGSAKIEARQRTCFKHSKDALGRMSIACFLEQFQTIAGQEIAEDREFGLPI